MRHFVLIFLILCSQLSFGQMDSLRTYYQLSVEAYKAGEYIAFLKYTVRANEIRPNHPALAYNLASAYAINAQKEEAVNALSAFLRMNASLDYQQDTDFDSLKGYEPYEKLSEQVAESTKKMINYALGFSLSQKKDHYESITYDENSGAFFLGTINTRRILRYENGIAKEFLADEPRLYSVMGLDIDRRSNMLWVCSAALPEMQGYADTLQNMSSVFGIDLTTGMVKFSYLIPEATLGDLISIDNGTALATDGAGNKIYELRPDGYSVFADLSGTLLNLQGLSKSGDQLLISDYLTGLYSLDLKSKSLKKFSANNLYSEKGTDGLLSYQDHIISFQNGTQPKRVACIRFDKHKVEQIKIIEQNSSLKGEPTQGLIVGDTLYYLATSAWDAYEEGKYQSGSATDLEIRKLNLVKFLIK
ncbi:MAG: hypothetical protein RIC30_11860 [Marinoscillum sp.]|uniref:hypothetical protein n=1 Tax=Marinoscillum sp. TaxID=2024838 RepID=UPI0032F2C682